MTQLSWYCYGYNYLFLFLSQRYFSLIAFRFLADRVNALGFSSEMLVYTSWDVACVSPANSCCLLLLHGTQIRLVGISLVFDSSCVSFMHCFCSLQVLQAKQCGL